MKSRPGKDAPVNLPLHAIFGFLIGLVGLLFCQTDSLAETFEQPEPTIARSTFAAVPLRQPEKRSLGSSDSAPNGIAATRSSATPLITVGSSLAIVLGLFGAFVWVSKKAASKNSNNREVPDEAMKLLGKRTLSPGNSILLVRCGRSVLIIGMTSAGLHRLGEIADDEEARHLEALCMGQSKASFNELLTEMQREPIKRGFVGEGVQRTSSSKLFSVS
jgi:flagellar biogenesis protein FliO